MASGLLNTLTREANMKTPVDAGRRAMAAALALSVTFSIVWAVAAYAHPKPADAQMAQSAGQKSCRG